MTSPVMCKCCELEPAEDGDPDAFCTECSIDCVPLADDPQQGPDAMTVADPFAALARKWALLAEHSPAGERAALTLMVADLWKTIDEASRP